MARKKRRKLEEILKEPATPAFEFTQEVVDAGIDYINAVTDPEQIPVMFREQWVVGIVKSVLAVARSCEGSPTGTKLGILSDYDLEQFSRQ